jgi:hypothetical protein
MRENGVRTSERRKESLIEQLAERKALAARESNFKDWQRRKAELEEVLQKVLRDGGSPSGDFDVRQLTEAAQMVDRFEKALAQGLPLGSDELAAARAQVEASAPHVRGSFRD